MEPRKIVINYCFKEFILILAAITSIEAIIIYLLLSFPGFRIYGVILLGLLVILECIFLLFYRDPLRLSPSDEKAVISPADGKIVEVEDCFEDKVLHKEATRIDIFLSLFDVHINWAPFTGEVVYLEHQRGKFSPAYTSEAMKSNERLFIGLYNKEKQIKILLVAIAGVFARRILFINKIGDIISQGQKIGMIKLGSRFQVYVPKENLSKINVKVGDKVRGGESILFYLR